MRQRVDENFVQNIIANGGWNAADVEVAPAAEVVEEAAEVVEEEGQKPDFLDKDGDGDKKESMKDAAKDAKKKKQTDEEKPEKTEEGKKERKKDEEEGEAVCEEHTCPLCEQSLTEELSEERLLEHAEVMLAAFEKAGLLQEAEEVEEEAAEEVEETEEEEAEEK